MEIQDYDWEFLTFMYMEFKFKTVQYNYENQYRCNFEKGDFGKFTDYYISIMERYVSHMDWNVILNTSIWWLKWGAVPKKDGYGGHDHSQTMAFLDSRKEYREFIEKYKTYIKFDKIKMGVPSKYTHKYIEGMAINFTALSILIEEIDKISII